jgi:uncharacterized membrane protein
VPTDGDTPRARHSLGKGRLEAFSDGVFSIAATLLVLDIAVDPNIARHSQPPQCVGVLCLP